MTRTGRHKPPSTKELLSRAHEAFNDSRTALGDFYTRMQESEDRQSEFWARRGLRIIEPMNHANTKGPGHFPTDAWICKGKP
jgi:hypothetical protein